MPSLDELLQTLGPLVTPEQLAPQPERQLPGPGFIPGELRLFKDLAPQVPAGAARPFAPGEFNRNPDGSWSSEETMTVYGDPTFNGGQPTVIPSLWIKDGKPYVAASEEEAIALAKASGLTFPSFPTPDAAEQFSKAREASWQGMSPEQAVKVQPLYQPTAREFIEPPPPPSLPSSTGALGTIPPPPPTPAR